MADNALPPAIAEGINQLVRRVSEFAWSGDGYDADRAKEARRTLEAEIARALNPVPAQVRVEEPKA